MLPVTVTDTAWDMVLTLRQQIRGFIETKEVDGHTTVIYSASVERSNDGIKGLTTVPELIEALHWTQQEQRAHNNKTDDGLLWPPSLLYAVAAAMEGCSFVNGASQNTLDCPGLLQLYDQSNGYCLGTDYKAGQTKFKTAAVEYLRTLGLAPKVIASANHLGNNDMHNLATNAKTCAAKLRVKHDIFAPWPDVAAHVDHKVAVMYTPYINDEKRDYVEYTSLGFCSQTHTMVTYTRASDSVLCVPLMIDAAIWCHWFASRQWPAIEVARATSYLFKVPEGGARGVDPGFFAQMQTLEHIVQQSSLVPPSPLTPPTTATTATATTDSWTVPLESSVMVCAGLACVDMQLLSTTGRSDSEDIQPFAGQSTMAGGSVSMCTKTLARLTTSTNSQPLLSKVVPLCMAGADDTGIKLTQLLQQCGTNVDAQYISSVDSHCRTALAVLPIYSDGRRGCFFDAASNVSYQHQHITQHLPSIMNNTNNNSCPKNSQSQSHVGAMIFGYPHLLPQMQGENLRQLLSSIKSTSPHTIVALDLNGVPPPSKTTTTTDLRTDLSTDAVLGPALPYMDILHMNEEELQHLTGCGTIINNNNNNNQKMEQLKQATSLFLACGVSIVVVTLGKDGCFIHTATTHATTTGKDWCLKLPSSWKNRTVQVPATPLPSDVTINANGAGDSFLSGFVLAAVLRKATTTKQQQQQEESTLSLEAAATLASSIAAHHVNTNTRNQTELHIDSLLSF